MNAARPTLRPHRPSGRLLDGAAAPGVLISASRDPDAKLTFVTTGARTAGAERLAVKIPATDAAGVAVDREGRMLVDVRRLGLGPLAATLPRYVDSLDVDGRPVLVSTAVPGVPMSIAYHRWGHTARRGPVRDDVEAAFGWLAQFQAATSRAEAPAPWPAQVLEQVCGRWDGHPALAPARLRLERAVRALAGTRTLTTAVHGDFWFGNLLTDDGRVSGVVDWEGAVLHGSPLPDAVRFVLSYGLYLDRHTRPGHRVLGHPRLVRTGFAPGIGYTLCGAGWFPDLARRALAGHLQQAGVSPALWYDAALVGVGEVAATANDDDFGAGHLELLATLPLRARRHRRAGR